LITNSFSEIALGSDGAELNLTAAGLLRRLMQAVARILYGTVARPKILDYLNDFRPKPETVA
jgi:hypothetical protein